MLSKNNCINIDIPMDIDQNEMNGVCEILTVNTMNGVSEIDAGE